MTDIDTASPLVRTVGNREYGSTMSWEDRAKQAPPDFCVTIYDEMIASSELHKLANGSKHDAIYKAYGTDIMFLKGRLEDIRNMVESAVYFSKPSWVARNILDEVSEWKEIKKSIPSFGSINLLTLTAEMATLHESVLLPSLKAGYANSVEELLSRMCLWLDTLTAYEFVGQVDMMSPTVGRYFYYRRSVIKETINIYHYTEKTVRYVPFGTHVILRKTERECWREDHNVELHIHDIVHAAQHGIDDYGQRIPNRVSNFLDYVSPWLLAHMKILSGTMTHEEVIKRTVGSTKGFNEKHTRSEFMYDPAVTLGNYAFVGWTDSDMPDGGVYSRLQKKYHPVKHLIRKWRARLVRKYK